MTSICWSCSKNEIHFVKISNKNKIYIAYNFLIVCLWLSIQASSTTIIIETESSFLLKSKDVGSEKKLKYGAKAETGTHRL